MKNGEGAMGDTADRLSSDAPSATPGEVLEIATLAGGCFWCLEAVYNEMEGVARVESGYTGGHVDQPTYRQVCSGESGHAEVVQVHFDPSVRSYRDLLEVFLTIHDPTTLNRQGADVGTQYRSAIFYHSEEQRQTAARVIAELEEAGIFDDPIVTEVAPMGVYFSAETEHQSYYRSNRLQPYCQFVVRPKVSKFRAKFADWVQKD